MTHIYDKKDADKFSCWNFKRNLLSNPDPADKKHHLFIKFVIMKDMLVYGFHRLGINVKPDELFLGTLPKPKPLTYTEPSKY